MTDTTTAAHLAETILRRCVAGRTHKLSRTVDGIFNQELRALGLRNTQLTMLSVLAFMGSATAAELGPVLVMDKSTVSRNLRVLRDKGWIAPDRRAGDQRLRVTRAGRSLLERALPAWERAQRRIAELIGEDGVEALRTIGDDLGVIPGETD